MKPHRDSSQESRSLRPVRPVALAVAVAVSVLLSYLALRDVDFELFIDTIGDSSYWWLLPALASMAIAVAIRVARWRSLFPSETRPPAAVGFRAFLVGELVNIVLPFRMGELARVVVVHRETRLSRTQILGTIFVERLLDVFVLLLLLFAVLPFVPDVAWIDTAMIVMVVVVVTMSVLVIVLRRHGVRPLAFLLGPLSRFPRFTPVRVGTAAESLLRGLRGLQDLRTGVTAAILTAAGWLAMALAYWFAIRGLNVEVGYEAAVLVVVTTTFALVIPSLPAAVGVFEAATLVALQPFGVDDSRALACAVVIHVLSILAFAAAGMWAGRAHRAVVSQGRAMSPA